MLPSKNHEILSPETHSVTVIKIDMIILGIFESIIAYADTIAESRVKIRFFLELNGPAFVSKSATFDRFY